MLKYHKVGNYREVNGETEHAVVFAPGDQTGSFKVGNVRFALEICRDNGVGVYSQNGGSPVHVHLIVSASISPTYSHIKIVNGGVLLHADSEQRDDTGKFGRVQFVPPTTSTKMTTKPAPGVKFLKLVMDDGASGITPTGDLKLTSTTLGFSEPPPPKSPWVRGVLPPPKPPVRAVVPPKPTWVRGVVSGS